MSVFAFERTLLRGMVAMLKRGIIALVVLLLVGGALACTGCGGSKPESGEAGGDQTAPAAQTEAARGTVTMNGRSVMEGWMSHWGYTGEGTVASNGYAFDYRELDGERIVSSFTSNVDGLEPGSVVFFKFCFVDFNGENLEERERQVEEVISAALDRQLRLIIGNALPVREQDGSEGMLSEYRAFNAFVAEKAAGHPGSVWAYDFYGVLAGSDGWLKPEYQTEDSHPNDVAYSELDKSFFTLLDEIFAESAR